MTEETAATNAAPEAIAPETQVAESAPAATDAGAEPKPDGMTVRIDELTRNWRDEQRRNEQLMALLQQRTDQPKADSPKPEEKLKTLADFEYDDAKYQQYIFELAERRSVEAARRELNAEKEREAGERRKSSFKSREAEFEKTVDDYSETWDALTRYRIPDDVAKAIKLVAEESEDGPALFYHLGKNRDVTEKLAQLPPLVAAKELGKIEAHLAYEREKAKEKPKVSQAPPPPPKLEGSGDRVDKNPREMTQAEFEKWRGKVIASRR